MKFTNHLQSLPQFTKYNVLKTFTEQIGYLAIASVREELSAESAAARAALGDVMGIDEYNEMKNDASDTAMDAAFRSDSGFTTVDPLPKTHVFAAYKYMYANMKGMQLFSKYPVRSLPEQIAQIGELKSGSVAIKKIQSETVEFLSTVEKDAGLNDDLINASYLRRKAGISEHKAQREDTMTARVMTEIANAYPDRMDFVWGMLPPYAQWKVLVACYKDMSRAVGSLKADAESNATNPWSNASADHDAAVTVVSLIKEELDNLSQMKGAELKAAYENKKLHENHII